jgi:hypothetical protein
MMMEFWKEGLLLIVIFWEGVLDGWGVNVSGRGNCILLFLPFLCFILFSLKLFSSILSCLHCDGDGDHQGWKMEYIIVAYIAWHGMILSLTHACLSCMDA